MRNVLAAWFRLAYMMCCFWCWSSWRIYCTFRACQIEQLFIHHHSKRAVWRFFKMFHFSGPRTSTGFGTAQIMRNCFIFACHKKQLQMLEALPGLAWAEFRFNYSLRSESHPSKANPCKRIQCVTLSWSMQLRIRRKSHISNMRIKRAKVVRRLDEELLHTLTGL